jgi:hypothetical protein
MMADSNPIRAEAVERLLPCPFCGHDAAASDGGNGLHFRVICNNSNCRAAGPLERCSADAISTWNTRAALEAGSGDGGLREALKPFADAIEEWGGDRAEPQKVSVWEHPIAMLVSVEDFWRAYDAVRTALSRSDGMGGMRPCYGERMPESDPIAEQFIERLKQTMAADIGRFVRAGRTPEQIVDGLLEIPEVRQAIELRAKGLTAIKRMG